MTTVTPSSTNLSGASTRPRSATATACAGGPRTAQAARRRAPGAVRVERFQASCAKVEARRASVPAIRYDDSSPIAAKRDEIKAAIAAHQVVVIAGETGSGKPPSCRRSARSWGAASTA